MVEFKRIKQQLNKVKSVLWGNDSRNALLFKESILKDCNSELRGHELPPNSFETGEETKKYSEKNYKQTFAFGFSLAEVLIAMLIMSIFYLATSKVVSVKQKPQTQENPHGYYECYNKAGLKERRVDNNQVTIKERDVINCTFRPINGLPFYNIYVVIPGMGFYSNPEAQINEDTTIQFGGALGLINMYADLEADIGLNDDQNIFTKMADQSEIKFQQFRGYLYSSHPNSMLAQDWLPNSVNPPYSAVFIVW